ncbi:MAG: HD domain-containing phosphohydrolase [Acidobacteriota bacterium]
MLIVSAAGLAVLSECIRELRSNPIGLDWLPLAALTLLSGSFTIKVPKLPARLSVSETFVFASVLLFGTCAGTVTVALEILVASLRSKHASKEPIRVVFNVCAAALAIWAAGHLFYALAPPQPLSGTSVLPNIFVPLVALAGFYFLLNSGFVAVALALEKSANAFWIWRNNFLWLSLNYFGAASVAALLISYTRTVDLTALGIIVPLLVISHLTYKTTLGRIEDASRHVEEVNQLYLSTIETLATAIDAKDQVTSGHIRRVQRFTLGLARELGVTDTAQLKALEAAALLHDTGKLVVPEHILNKPGKLSPGEFERMKRHASAGAEILSAIKFPYPVVPIVRHHHENWDGSGYPDGLRGTDIPLGARILAVVDCFDALTSDRPYRRSLLDDEAMEILLQRRGNMYDPLVVDTFAATKDKLAAAHREAEPPSEPAFDRTALRETEESSEPRLVMRVVDDEFAAAIRTVLSSAQDATSATFAVLYLRDSTVDEAFVAGVSCSGHLLERNSMPLGAGVTGWVIANGRPVINSDAALDFVSVGTPPSVSKCTSVPIDVRGETVGALSCYLADPRGFGDRDLAVMEKIASKFDVQPLQDMVNRTMTRFVLAAAPRSVH